MVHPSCVLVRRWNVAAVTEFDLAVLPKGLPDQGPSSIRESRVSQEPIVDS